MSYVPPQPGNLENSNGPFVLGVSMSCILTGMLITQTWNYFERYEQDTWSLKFAAGLVCILNIVSTGLDLQIVWNIGVTHFGDYAALHRTPMSHQYSILLTSFVTLTTQIFFAQRSWRAVNQNVWMGALFFLLVLTTFTGAFGCEVAHLAGAPQPTVVKPMALMWLWTSSVTDTLISGVLMYRLWGSRQQPDLSKRTQNALDGILVVILSTAAVTTAAASTDAIFFSFFSHSTNTHSALTICIPRLYGNCLLFTLNSRSKLRSSLHQSKSKGSSSRSASSSAKQIPTWHGRNDDQQHPSRASLPLTPRSPPPPLPSPQAQAQRTHRGVVVTRRTEVESQRASTLDLARAGYAHRSGPLVRGQDASPTSPKHVLAGAPESEKTSLSDVGVAQ